MRYAVIVSSGCCSYILFMYFLLRVFVSADSFRYFLRKAYHKTHCLQSTKPQSHSANGSLTRPDFEVRFEQSGFSLLKSTRDRDRSGWIGRDRIGQESIRQVLHVVILCQGPAPT